MVRKGKTRRSAKRNRTHNLISVRAVATGEKFISNLLNISRQGASLVSKKILSVGDEVEIHLKIPSEKNELKNVEIRSKVIWIEPIENAEGYLTGVQFLNMSEEDFQVIKKLLGEG